MTARELARNVRTARTNAGLTQEQLAVRSGITARTIVAIEAGHRTRVQQRVLDGLAAGLGVNVDVLTHGTDRATPATAGTESRAA